MSPPYLLAVALLLTTGCGRMTGGLGGADADGDGYVTHADGGADCNDTDPDIHPDVEERCDGVDNDCDGLIDERVLLMSYADSDGDGHGDASTGRASCDGDVAPRVTLGDDCDDAAASTYPGAEEICDGIDNDCNGEIDDGEASGQVWYADTDGDGHGDPENTQLACTSPGTDWVTRNDDCDDSAATVYPGAEELCDTLDNDCDSDVDETSPTWFTDADNDGFGDPNGETVTGCDDPGDHWVADARDCNDADLQIFPGALERCNELDDNCNGDVDEGATDPALWFRDADGDGYGSPVQTEQSCEQPTGYVAVDTDCDDASAAVNPEATETCDGVDEDCNDLIDDEPLDPIPFYLDADGDGFGTQNHSSESCALPDGYSANRDDCDDDSATVNPEADEVCNEVDDDCDNSIDEAGATGETSWYLDADADGYGDASDSLLACVGPQGRVDNDSDCDDGDAALNPDTLWFADADGDGFGDANASTAQCLPPDTYVDDSSDCDDDDPRIAPGADDWFVNGVDNDCDGAVDQDRRLGAGDDGALDLSSPFVLDQDRSNGRSHPDGATYPVTQIDGVTVLTSEPPVGMAAGDEVLVLNLHGSDAQHDHVGTWELGEVVATSNNSITLSSALTKTFAESGNSSLSGQSVLVQRIPHYTEVVVRSGGELTTSRWDTATGGIVALRATEQIDVRSGGVIHADGLGYHGGVPESVDDCDGAQGESYAGWGVGEVDSSKGCKGHLQNNYNNNNGTNAYNAHYGGGGTYITGGGGNYAGGATAGGFGSTPKGAAGGTYGTADLSVLFFGSGGGATWSGDKVGNNRGPSGSGGGIVFLTSERIKARGTGAIRSNGTSSDYYSVGTLVYGASAGAGGSVWLAARTLDLANNSVQATGGTSPTPPSVGNRNVAKGGDGGTGRVRIDVDTSANVTPNAACTPDPGHTATF